MITAKYINPLKQYGTISYDLVISSNTGEIEPIRIPKKFKDTVTKIQLEAQADFDLKEVLSNLKLGSKSVGVTTIDKPSK